MVLLNLTALFDPSRDRVLCLEIGGSGCSDCFGGCKSLLLPLQAAADHPIENAGPFRREFFLQRVISALGRDRDGKGYKVEASPYRFVD